MRAGRRATQIPPVPFWAAAAAHAFMDDPAGVARLLDRLRAVGADEQAAALIARLPAAGMFELFLEQQGRKDQFRFGLEHGGIAATPWNWGDLDLRPTLQPRRSRTASAALARVSIGKYTIVGRAAV